MKKLGLLLFVMAVGAFTAFTTTYKQVKTLGPYYNTTEKYLSLIHISEPTRLLSISYAVFCLKKKIFFLIIRRPPRSTLDRSSAASDVYKRQLYDNLQTS